MRNPGATNSAARSYVSIPIPISPQSAVSNTHLDIAAYVLQVNGAESGNEKLNATTAKVVDVAVKNRPWRIAPAGPSQSPNTIGEPSRASPRINPETAEDSFLNSTDRKASRRSMLRHIGPSRDAIG